MVGIDGTAGIGGIDGTVGIAMDTVIQIGITRTVDLIITQAIMAGAITAGVITAGVVTMVGVVTTTM